MNPDFVNILFCQLHKTNPWHHSLDDTPLLLVTRSQGSTVKGLVCVYERVYLNDCNWPLPNKKIR